jgi:hypothetical protein
VAGSIRGWRRRSRPATTRCSRRCASPGSRAAIQRKNTESFRCCVHSRRKTGRTSTNDRNIEELFRIDGAYHADAPRELGLAWIAQQLPTRTKHNRQIKIIHVEALYQCIRAFIRVGVQSLVRISVSREERFQPKHVRVVRAADDNGSYASFNEPDTAKDESA